MVKKIITFAFIFGSLLYLQNVSSIDFSSLRASVLKSASSNEVTLEKDAVSPPAVKNEKTLSQANKKSNNETANPSRSEDKSIVAADSEAPEEATDSSDSGQDESLVSEEQKNDEVAKIIPENEPAYPKILISEIQISPKEERFVELYNPNEEDVDLAGWYIQRKTETGSSWDTFISSNQFEGKRINAKSYFLVANYAFADIASSLTLTENNSLVLKNPSREVVDLVGWGNAQEFQTAPALTPDSGQSIGRIWSGNIESYIDTVSNYTDFAIDNSTPGAKNKVFEIGSQLPADSSTSSSSAVTTTSIPAVEQNKNYKPLDVVINEVDWMGTDFSASDEWLELYNNTTEDINLSDWFLGWNHGTTAHLIDFSTSSGVVTAIIKAKSFYLIERTDDNTVAGIPADWIGSFGYGLNNSGEEMKLLDGNSNVIDLFDCTSGWFAGDNSTKQTMERVDSLVSGNSSENWRSSVLPGGTPKAKNSVSL